MQLYVYEPNNYRSLIIAIIIKVVQRLLTFDCNAFLPQVLQKPHFKSPRTDYLSKKQGKLVPQQMCSIEISVTKISLWN